MKRGGLEHWWLLFHCLSLHHLSVRRLNTMLALKMFIVLFCLAKRRRLILTLDLGFWSKVTWAVLSDNALACAIRWTHFYFQAKPAHVMPFTHSIPRPGRRALCTCHTTSRSITCYLCRHYLVAICHVTWFGLVQHTRGGGYMNTIDGTKDGIVYITVGLVRWGCILLTGVQPVTPFFNGFVHLYGYVCTEYPYGVPNLPIMYPYRTRLAIFTLSPEIRVHAHRIYPYCT